MWIINLAQHGVSCWGHYSSPFPSDHDASVLFQAQGIPLADVTEELDKSIMESLLTIEHEMFSTQAPFSDAYLRTERFTSTFTTVLLKSL